jgi:hypothetical protein
MTLDQAVAHIEAKLAERGATAADQAIVDRDSDEEDDPEFGSTPLGAEPYDDSALDETADGVSAGESEQPDSGPDAAFDARPITLPDGSTITVAEARKGYLRQADFTRKTQELARDRERVAARAQAVEQELIGLFQQAASLQEAEPDWQALARNATPEEFQRVQGMWRRKAAQAAHVRELSAQAHTRALAAQQQQMWDTLATGSFEPAWRERSALRADMETLTTYLAERGIPADLVRSISTPAVIEIAEESRRYRELQKARPKAALAVRGKPQPFTPGAKSGASPQSENIRLLNEAFVKNPSLENAIALEQAKAARRR